MYNDRHDTQKLPNVAKHQGQGFPTRYFNPVGKSNYPSHFYTGLPFPQRPISFPHSQPFPIPPSQSEFCGCPAQRAPNMMYAPYRPMDLRHTPFSYPMGQYMGTKTSVLQNNGFSYYQQSLLLRNNNTTTQYQNGTHFISRSIAGAQITKNEQQQQQHKQISYTCPTLVDKCTKNNNTEMIRTQEPGDERDFTRYDLISAINQITPFKSHRASQPPTLPMQGAWPGKFSSSFCLFLLS